MQFYPHRTVEEQANRLPEEFREAYKKSQIDRIIMFDGYKSFELTGYAEYSYHEEKSYKTQPIRSQDGTIVDIEEYATFLTPRLIVKYNMMGIDDYRSFMKMIKGRNGFIIKCYDQVEDKIVTNEMYVATPSMPIIYQQYLMALGIKEYNIELIGTNAKRKLINRNVIDEAGIGGSIPFGYTYGSTWRELSEEDNRFSIGTVSGVKDCVKIKFGDRTGLVETRYPYTPVKADDFILDKDYYIKSYVFEA